MWTLCRDKQSELLLYILMPVSVAMVRRNWKLIIAVWNDNQSYAQVVRVIVLGLSLSRIKYLRLIGIQSYKKWFDRLLPLGRLDGMRNYVTSHKSWNVLYYVELYEIEADMQFIASIIQAKKKSIGNVARAS